MREFTYGRLLRGFVGTREALTSLRSTLFYQCKSVLTQAEIYVGARGEVAKSRLIHMLPRRSSLRLRCVRTALCCQTMSSRSFSSNLPYIESQHSDVSIW